MVGFCSITRSFPSGDGAVLSSDAQAPYSASWDTTAVADGPHVLSAVAWDAAGNSAHAADVTVQVDNVAAVNICSGHCGAQATQGCWCDAQCGSYGDCCQDDAGGRGAARSYVDAVCAPPPSTNICQGHCGGQAAQGCWCDSQCNTYGDCCQNDSGGQGASHAYVDMGCP